MSRFRSMLSLSFLALLALAGRAQTNDAVDTVQESPWVPQDPRAKEFLDVSFRPELDIPVPLDLEFMADDGQRSTLRDRLMPGKPTLLALVYYRCPSMCNLVMNGMVDTLNEIDLQAGVDFNLLAVSFDKEETHVVAAGKKKSALNMYNQSGGEAGWHFMVGNEPEIAALTGAVNFGFKYDPAIDEYAHGSGLLVLTPDGRLSRFLPGILYPRRDLQLALVEAGEGKIGSLTDKFALLCYQYDPQTGKYGLLINRVVMVACLATVAAMAFLIFSLLRQERRSSAAEHDDTRNVDSSTGSLGTQKT